MAHVPHSGPGITGRLLLAVGVAMLALVTSVHAQKAAPQFVPPDAPKPSGQLPSSIDATAPSSINAESPSTVQADINPTYIAQPETDLSVARHSPRPASSFAPARQQGPLPSTNRPAGNKRPLDSTRLSPQLVSPVESHKDFTYASRPAANARSNASPAKQSASGSPRGHAAVVTSSSPGSSNSSSLFAGHAHKSAPAPTHTAHKTNQKSPAAGAKYGASKPYTFNSKLDTTIHSQTGKKNTLSAKPLK